MSAGGTSTARLTDAAALDLMNYIPRAMSSDDLFDLIKQAY